MSYRLGQGPVWLLMHGWSGSASQFYPLMSHIAAQGFKRVLKDAAFEGCDALGKPALGFEGSAVVTFQAQGEALGDVAQFTHVARPVVAHQVRQGLVVEVRHAAVEAQG